MLSRSNALNGRFALFMMVFMTHAFSLYAQGKFDYGKVDKGVYKNKYFDLEITLPDQWVIQDKEQLKQITDRGKELLSDDKAVHKALDAAAVNTAYLITLFKYEMGSPVDFNPSFVALAENMKAMPGVKTGKDYLFHATKLLLASDLNYKIDDEVEQKQIGSKEFYVLNLMLTVNDKTIYQEYITTIVNGFALSFLLCYDNDDDKQMLFAVIDKIKI